MIEIFWRNPELLLAIAPAIAVLTIIFGGLLMPRFRFTYKKCEAIVVRQKAAPFNTIFCLERTLTQCRSWCEIWLCDKHFEHKCGENVERKK